MFLISYFSNYKLYYIKLNEIAVYIKYNIYIIVDTCCTI